MRRRWCDWQLDGNVFRKLAERAMEQEGGTYRVYTVLNHVSPSGMTRWISAFVPVVKDGKAELVCVARERKLEGCGMDMGFELAYRLHREAFDDGVPYQKALCHSWL